MRGESRSALFRYGLSLALFALVIGLSTSLLYLGIKINLTVPVIAAIVAAAWFAGRGPAILISVLIAIVSLVGADRTQEPSTPTLIFAQLSALALLVFVVFLVSGRKTAQEESKRQSELFRTTLASIGDAVIASDADGNVTFLNPTAERLIDVPSESAIGKPLKEVYRLADESTGDDVSDVFETIKDRRDIVTSTSNATLKRQDGSDIPIIDSGAPILDEDGRFLGSVIVFQDDTARREAEQVSKDAEHRQQQSQKLEAIGTLTGGVAHDFNNLLTAILGYTELAMRKLDPNSPAYDNLANVEKAGNRAAELTTKLLAFSRRQKLENRIINLNESIEDILKLLQRLIGVDISVRFKGAPDLGSVNADPLQIEQVIMNLSLNARDAMPKGGRLAIETRNVVLDEYYCRQYPSFEPGEYVQVQVSDTGSGMDRQTIDRMFEPFFTTKEVDKGTGLGLSLVYGIIKQHKGHINVYSEVGHGTTFKFYLPIAHDAVEEGVSELKPALAGGIESILVADDEEALRNLSGDVLRALGYTVILAENGEEAVKLFQQNADSIDLLLFDVVMPLTGGIEAYRMIKDSGSEVPVIFMTGYSSEVMEDSKSSMLELSSLPIIQKPYTLDALGRIVRETLDSRSQ
ncbi:MAG: ATP-binding protein [Pyrinomonadaceae bacterium]